MAKSRTATSIAALSLLLASCGGGSNGGGATPPPSPSPTSPNPFDGGLYTAPAQEALTVAEVKRIVAQAAGEAAFRGLPVDIAVVDRVGNVLAAFRMDGVNQLSRISNNTPFVENNVPPVDLQDEEVPTMGAAISKAITGAYLSSGGQAFSTRTASMIVQEHFPPSPLTPGIESGPLFGVQFSSLACSDLMARWLDSGQAEIVDPVSHDPLMVPISVGPKRAPLGLSADAGGLPLYKNGQVVGGIGVMGDRDYSFDPNVLDTDISDEEAIALSGTLGFQAPEDIRADRIPVDGTTLRFSDMTVGDLNPTVTDYDFVEANYGSLLEVFGYFDGLQIIAGTPYGTEASGVRAATPAEFRNSDAFVLSDGNGNARYPIRGGTDAGLVAQPLTEDETRALLEEAFAIMSRARAQIRRPLDSRAQVTISVVDTKGEILGIVRGPDAPMFGTDVSLQKARTAAFFSNRLAGSQLLANPDTDVASFVQRVRDFLGDPNALTGTVAFADRSGGNLSRPYFPDGEVGRGPGPLSRPIEDFSPFAVGLQVAMVRDQIVQHALFVARVAAFDVEHQCTNTPRTSPGHNRLANGIQIFPGSVPIYRGDQLIGGIGISGDGIDQDDMISFLGTHNAGERLGTIGNAPQSMRANNIVVDLGDGRVTRLRYIVCPFAPFLDTDQSNVCEGK